jgi:phage tail sheath gpL-like
MVGFKEYAPTNRTPLFFAELDNSRANQAQQDQRTLIIGQMLSTGTLTAGTQVLAESVDAVKLGAGPGSMLALQMEWYRKRDSFGEVHILPLADNGAGVAATGTITATAVPTATGTIPLYIAGKPVPVLVSTSLNTATLLAAAIAAAINADTDLPVTAAPAVGVVTLTAKHKGLTGNDIDIRLAYRGPLGGEVMPAGVALTIVAMANGTTNPVLDTALAALGDELFDFIVLPYTDTTSLDAIKTFLAARWSWDRMLYGHAFAGFKGTVSAASTLGSARNDPHVTIMPMNNSPTPSWLLGANLAGAVAVSLRADPGLPLQALALDVLPPPPANRFTISERNVLLYDGMSSFIVAADGTVTTERIITTYQTNPSGQPDDSYLDVEKLFTLMFVIRDLKTFVTSTYGRFKLASDGTIYRAGSNIVTPAVIRDGILGRYRFLEREGFVQEYARFRENLIVERNGSNSCRVDALLPIIPIDQLRQIVSLVQFRKGGTLG